MCGIVGIYYFDPERSASEETVKIMADAMVHRGPDDAGYHTSRNASIGMRRLSIIDLAGGHQPIFSHDSSKTIVFNGEMYNFREERVALESKGHTFHTHTDTEVVLRLYEEYGVDFFRHLNGMYGLAILDNSSRELLLARDHIGVKPLYYYHDHEKLVFASEIKSILAIDSIDTCVNPQGLSAFFGYGFTPAPHTLFRNIYKLPPAHYLRVRDGDVHIERYWSLSYQNKHQGSIEQVSGELFDLLKSAVEMQLVSDVPLGAFLSGGMDSSGLVHMMKALGSKSIDTYSIGFGEGFGAVDELDDARIFAKDYQTNHHEIVVKPDVASLFPDLVASLDEPIADSSFIVTYLVSKLAKESSTVILSGVGGDELFGGYRRYLNVRLDSYYKHIPTWIRTQVIQRLLANAPVDRNSTLLNYLRLAKTYASTAELPPKDQYASYTTILDTPLREELLHSPEGYEDFHAKYFNECDSDDILDKIMYFDLNMSLPDQLLMLSDKMSMKTSLEARVPYLDHRVVEYAARIPSEYKIKGLNLRLIQKKAFAGQLPDYVFKRKKKGFGAPIGTWIRNELHELINDMLSEERLKAQGLLNPKTVHYILNEHYKYKADHTDHILALITFQLWHQAYFNMPS